METAELWKVFFGLAATIAALGPLVLALYLDRKANQGEQEGSAG